MVRDILLYMSDQHSYNLQGYAGNPVVRTPTLDKLAKQATVMTNAMTSCPLCVPARASMISGLLPSNNGVLFNFNSISSDQATFLHSLTVSGYDTVLCGRMHFVGPDQRHGYAKRIAGDRTPVFHNGVPNQGMKGGTQIRGFDENSSVYYMGGGDSPVLAYDRYVTARALEYLAGNYEKPQFITVGAYGPHFPYVAPKGLYDYYYDKVSLEGAEKIAGEHPVLDGKLCETDPDVVRAARAAYYGLVETTDYHIETVYKAFREYVERNGHEGIFIYVSDHGDMNGDRGYYGKQVFYDPSVHIPFLIEGDGIPKGKVIDTPVSIMDMGPTICELAGAEILPGDGKSLVPVIAGEAVDEERMVVSEQYMYLPNGDTCLGRMVRYRNWKFTTYSGFEGKDQLFDCKADPHERCNVIGKYPEIAGRLKAKTEEYKDYDTIMIHENWLMNQLRILTKCNYDDQEERWPCPEIPMVENPVQRKAPFEPTPWAAAMRKKLQ
ncbi:MAG: sulfatase-like hydrolase/transferase [Lacrimispora sp.]|uniref:sulfatase-like hydrolase/transferase n=1 Tax=Lacrimispora sp. TaxID=2719234 RepID=UPI0039E4D3D7